LDVREILRRLQLGQGDRAIARDLTVSRKTVTKYRQWAAAAGLLTGPLPEPAALQALLAASLPVVPPPRSPFLAAPHRERIVALRRQGVECRAILERLREETGFTGSYSAVWRFVRALEPAVPTAYIRLETAPAMKPRSISGAPVAWSIPETGRPRRPGPS
jgi:transposase